MIARAAAVAGLAALPIVVPQPQRPTFSSRIEEIRVDVLATRGHQPVNGLTPADFEIRDNGVLQQITHATFENVPLNVVLALDGSNSVTGDRDRHLQAAGRELLAHLETADQAALVSFGDAVIVRSALTRDLGAVRSALDAEPPHGNTALVDASQTALLLAESQPGRALVLVFTDGVEVSSFLEADAALGTARRSAAVAYAVVPAQVAGLPFLRNLTDATGGEIIPLESTADLDAAFARVLDQFRRRYLLSYTPQGVERGGWHRLDVRVKQRGVQVKARPGYLGD
jgi:VWFA-related protein